MTNSERKGERDAIDAVLSDLLRPGGTRPLPLPRGGTRPLPLPRDGEPSDELLLLYLDGALADGENDAVERLLATHPYSNERVEIVKQALAEVGEVPAEQPSAIARLVFSIRASAHGALSFLRGTADLVPFAPATVATRGSEPAQAFEPGIPAPKGGPLGPGIPAPKGGPLGPGIPAPKGGPLGPGIPAPKGGPLGPGIPAPKAPSRGVQSHHIFRFRQSFATVCADITVEHAASAATATPMSPVGDSEIDVRVTLSDENGTLGDGRVSLRKAGQLVSSAKLRNGAVDFCGLEPASYELELKHGSAVVGEVALDFLTAQ